MALQKVAAGDYGVVDLFEKSTADNGPFGQHLRERFGILRHSTLLDSFKQVIQTKSCSDGDYYQLCDAGLVRMGQGWTVLPRCQLYVDYTKEHWGE